MRAKKYTYNVCSKCGGRPKIRITENEVYLKCRTKGCNQMAFIAVPDVSVPNPVKAVICQWNYKN